MYRYFSQLVEHHAKSRPNDIAHVFMDKETTWLQFNAEVNSVANSFIGLGLRPGDTIATILPPTPYFLTMFMAASTMGLVIVPLDPRLQVPENAVLCERTKPKLLLSMPYPVKSLIERYHFEHVYSCLGQLDYPDALPYEKLLEASSEPVPDEFHPNLDDPLIIIFTSGSTGRPKGAMITHRNSLEMARITCETWEANSNDRMIFQLPTSHVGGTHDIVATQLYAGATLVCMPAFNPVAWMEVITKYRVTVSGGVPTMYRLLFLNCDVNKYDLSFVRLLILGGEPSSPELIMQIKDSFPNSQVAASWGMTETTGYFTFTRLTDSVETVARTEGSPGFGLEMKILKTDNTWAEVGEIGELVVKGATVIKSYLNEEDNQDTFYDGWLKTGDLGFMDERGYLNFIGRKKEMYISGGYNVYPLEIETFLNAHPSINAACIIEVPDQVWGEVGYAFIVPEEGSNLTMEEIEAYCKEGLASFKRPRRIFIEKELPKTAVGKIAKQEVRKNIGKYIEA